MENDNGGIQNEFFNRVRKERTLVMIFLANGKRLIGRIKAFDKFTVLLETHHGDQIIFKHAISTVGPARSSMPDDEGPPHRDAAPATESQGSAGG
jgi:host factor-I protein